MKQRSERKKTGPLELRVVLVALNHKVINSSGPEVLLNSNLTLKSVREKKKGTAALI